ncbi:hypothetical protein FACS1894105_07030 [Clostridia bacterium]|nr:hypothetical protein FACS1894105_07030 [Clostridia bacterium]
MNNVSSKISEFLLQNIIHDVEELDETQQLIDNGWVDSISILKVILFMEKSFFISFDENDLLPEYFETLGTMTTLVHKKMSDNPVNA